MRIVIIGTGYVGLVTGTCFAEMGNRVTCIDINTQKIENLKRGIIPIYEPGLEELIKNNVKNGRLFFDTKLENVIKDADVVFSAVGTPPNEDGSADLKYVISAARTFGQCIEKHTVFVTKSTVPVGTAEKVRKAISEELDKRNLHISFDVVSNPEFLKEGTAVKDFMYPERVVIGVDSENAKDIMAQLYAPFSINDKDKIIFTTIPSAEMIKYAANSMLATRISFMNEIASLCEQVGANINDVKKGIGSDSRIGSKFLYAGCGYGGSCFPKDVKALIQTGVENGCDMELLKSVEDINAKQKHILFKKIQNICSDLSGKTICVWGIAFKPDTDDIREAPALTLLQDLTHTNCKVRIYDPIAKISCMSQIGTPDYLTYCDNPYDAAKGSDIIVLVTEWKEFRMIDWDKLSDIVNDRNIIDGRNIYDRKTLENKGFTYQGIGR